MRQGLAGNYESGIFFFEGDFDELASIRSAQVERGLGSTNVHHAPMD